MQTISVPYRCSPEAAATLAEWRRAYSAAVRTAYKFAAVQAADGGGVTFRDEKAVRDHVKDRFSAEKTVDAWLIHSATRDGIAQRKRTPDGRMVFGGKENLVRRSKGLISNEKWREHRLRPMTSLGDKTKNGNRHFRLSPDARSCTVAVYGKAVTLDLPKLRGKWAEILPIVAQMAAKNEVNVTFRIGKTLDVTFDETDLRRLKPGQTLQQAKDETLGSGKARGRPRGADYVPPSNPWPDGNRPVHPEWRKAVPQVVARWLGIDLNPGWIGLAAVETDGSLAGTKILEWRLARIDLPAGASDETVREALAAVVTQALSLARAWNVAGIAVEKGLGKLRSATKVKPLNRLINGWARNAFLSILGRRAGLAGLSVDEVWCGYSTLVGNVAFDVPDACAAASEVGRRGFCRRVGLEILPGYDAELACRRWKDGTLAVPQGVDVAGVRQGNSRRQAWRPPPAPWPGPAPGRGSSKSTAMR